MEELVRREVERCDRLAGLMAMMSVAGGTGSGVGTYVTQCLRDVYPKSFILNHLTWPYGTGEVWTLLSGGYSLMLLSSNVIPPPVLSGDCPELQLRADAGSSLPAVRRHPGARERHGAQDL